MTAPREVCMGTGERRVALGVLDGSKYRSYAEPVNLAQRRIRFKQLRREAFARMLGG